MAVLHNAAASSPPSEISQLVQAALQLPSRRSKIPGGLGGHPTSLSSCPANSQVGQGVCIGLYPSAELQLHVLGGLTQVVCFLAHTVGLYSRCLLDTPAVHTGCQHNV